MPETVYIITAKTADANARLDRFLTSYLPDLSRSRLQGLIAQSCVTCGSAVIDDAAAKVKQGKEYTLVIPETVPSHIMAQDIALTVIYEDKHLLIIDKPAGLTVHPAPGHPDSTLVNALLAHCGASLSGIGGVARPGIVHRIDKDTSGLLVVAKHDTAHLHLSSQLAERTLKRTYAAIVWGEPKPKNGTITGNIGRSLSNRQRMAVLPKGGKAAVTHYKTLQVFDSARATLVECNLETGRTHQIRVHFTHIGHPLVGDPVYGQSTQSRLNGGGYKSLPEKTRAALLGFKRQALHARALELIHPATGKKMRFEAELPKDMQDLIKALS